MPIFILTVNNLFPVNNNDPAALVCNLIRPKFISKILNNYFYLMYYKVHGTHLVSSLTALGMQLYIISPVFVYILWRSTKWGLVLLATFTLALLGANFAVFAVFNLLPTLMFSRMYEATSAINLAPTLQLLCSIQKRLDCSKYGAVLLLY